MKISKKEKILLGVTIISVGITGYFGFKYYKNEIIKSTLINNNDELKNDVNTLLKASSEGLFEEAIGTVNNKINYRMDKKKYLTESLKNNPNDLDANKALNKVETELKDLFNRKDSFIKAQELYGIKDEI